LTRPGLAAWPRITVAALVALTLLELLWGAVLAPLPGARWLAIKALPLALLVPGVAKGQRKARQWLALLTPLYFAEALVRSITESARQSVVAGAAAAIALLLFAAVLAWLRLEGRQSAGR